MLTDVEVAEVETLMNEGAQIVEVLPHKDYEEQHLPGAMSIPLSELPSYANRLDRERPVVVYCYDTECDMSPRAAALLVQLGVGEVYNFVGGKTAWLAAGLPSEGSISDTNRAGSLAREVPTCDMADDIATLAETIDLKGMCVVVNGEGVVLGWLGRDALDLTPEAIVGDVMDPGPVTIRPSVPRSELVDMFESSQRDHLLVTTYSGELLGAITPEDLGAHASETRAPRRLGRQS